MLTETALATLTLSVSPDAHRGGTGEFTVPSDPLLLDEVRHPIPYPAGPPCSVTIAAYGDVDLSGAVNIFDIFAVLDAFTGRDPCTKP